MAEGPPTAAASVKAKSATRCTSRPLLLELRERPLKAQGFGWRAWNSSTSGLLGSAGAVRLAPNDIPSLAARYIAPITANLCHSAVLLPGRSLPSAAMSSEFAGYGGYVTPNRTHKYEADQSGPKHLDPCNQVWGIVNGEDCYHTHRPPCNHVARWRP